MSLILWIIFRLLQAWVMRYVEINFLWNDEIDQKLQFVVVGLPDFSFENSNFCISKLAATKPKFNSISHCSIFNQLSFLSSFSPIVLETASKRGYWDENYWNHFALHENGALHAPRQAMVMVEGQHVKIHNGRVSKFMFSFYILVGSINDVAL